MKKIDRLLQRWRVAKIRPFVRPGARVLDLGCSDGALFLQLGNQIGEGIGIDPALDQPVKGANYQLIAGRFPQDLPDTRPFDIITLLAVLEHIPPAQQRELALNCARYLKPGGYLLVTVPSASADTVLHLLKLARLIDGMSLEEHYGFSAGKTPSVFSSIDLDLVRSERFQFGFNNLFVFSKSLF